LLGRKGANVGTNSGLFNILFVEDNSADGRLAMEAMKESSVPCSFKIAGNGEEAMSYLLSRDSDAGLDYPDIILLDLNLLEKGGLEVLKEIKGNPNLKHIPAIVLTTSSDERDIKGVYAVRANCCIPKPVNLDEFSKAIKAIVNYWATVVKL